MGIDAGAGLAEIVVSAAAPAAEAGLSAGEIVAGVGGVAAGGVAGAAAGGAFSGSSSTGAVPVNSPGSTTGPETSAGTGGTAKPPPGPGFFSNAVKASLASSVTSFGLQKAFGGAGRGVNIPPPPGAAMIDPEGAQAAAMLRQRQAAAGGLASTVTGAGANPAAFSSVTAGGKGLLGQ